MEDNQVNTAEAKQSVNTLPQIAPPQTPNPKSKVPIIALIIALLIALPVAGFFIYQNFLPRQKIVQNLPPVSESQESGVIQKLIKTVVSFETVSKATGSQVLGETSDSKELIPVQIFAFEDHNGNGVREPDDQALGFMPVSIFDSPFSNTPLKQISSTDSGWASVQTEVGMPYQLVVIPNATKQYVPTTKSVILSKTNNFATVGYQKKSSDLFHISIFAFEDANKDSNFNYDDSKEKLLSLAPFKFYQQDENGTWQLLPNSVNTTDTGWATTSLEVKYPYKVRVEAGTLNTLTPANKEIVVTNRNSTLVFPYISE